MKKVILIASLLVIGMIVSYFLGIRFYAQWCEGEDREDRAVADTIPEYTPATFWRVNDSDIGKCAFDAYDDPPSADIYFYSDDEPQLVLNFFKENLPKDGWDFKDSNETFTKKIGNNTAVLNLEHDSRPKVNSDSYNYHIEVTGMNANYQNK